MSDHDGPSTARRIDSAHVPRPASLSRAFQIDAACERFESAWRVGRAVRIEDMLDGHRGPEKAALLFELLALERDLRREQGEEPTARKYLDRFPDHARIVGEIFLDAPLGSTATTLGHEVGLAPAGRFGDYELLEEIARGGMGVVYRARQMSLNRVVALKMILSGEFASEAETRRFQIEAESAANLDHPQIVPIYEVGHHRGLPFYSMRLIAGGSLASHLPRFVGNDRLAARLLVIIARAMHHSHERGFVHRDLKPSNILLDDRDQPLVTDFGLAKRVEDTSGLTLTGAPLGTPAYMAPEQAAGTDVTASADIYSLGAILYQLLTGRPPVRAGSITETLAQRLGREPIPPRLLRPEIPRDLELVCLKCLETRPDDRYAKASDLADDLDRFLRDEGVHVGRLGFGDRLKRWARREPELAFRLLGLSTITALTQVNFACNPAPDVPVHIGVTAVEGAWLLSSLAFHRLARPEGRSERIRPAWIAADIALLTASLLILDASTNSLVVGYGLLIVASGLWCRVRLVWFTTVMTMAGYATLAFEASLRLARMDSNHHPNILLTAMAVMGSLVAHLVRRISALSTYHELQTRDETECRSDRQPRVSGSTSWISRVSTRSRSTHKNRWNAVPGVVSRNDSRAF